MVYTWSEAIVKHVGIKQARQELPDLIDRAEAGEETVITRQGKAVAKLIAAPKSLKPLPSLTEFRQQIGRAGTPAAQLLREERDGR
jgi:prevent-host-death family protein